MIVDVDHAIDALTVARTPADVVLALSTAMTPSGDLFVVDHEFAQARFVGGGRVVDLDGELSASLRSGRSVTTELGHWLPLLDGDDVVFGVLLGEPPLDDEAAALDRVSLVLGLCTPAIRSRYEDFERHRRRADMSVAAELQWDLLPARADRTAGYRFASVLEPAYDIAGDLFDYVVADGSLWLYSLDAMGHGVEATLSGVLALSAIRNARREGGSLIEQVQHANETIVQHWHGQRFVTAAACRLDADGIEIVNAGHEAARRRTGRQVRALQITADLPIGIDADHVYRSQLLAPLGPDESLILLSDGSSEARNVAGVAFGAAAVDAALATVWDQPPLMAAHAFVQRILEYADRDGSGDDITVVIASLESGDTANAVGPRSR